MGKRASRKSNPFAIFYSPEYRKFQTVVIGVAVAAASAGLLPATVAVWVLLVVSVLTAAGVYQVPNAGQTLVLQPAGTSPEVADVVIETPEPAVDSAFRGDVTG